MQQQTGGHTLKAFDQDIDRLRALISQMGGLAEHAIEEAMRCMRAGLLESPTMTHAQSLANMTTMDRIRAAIGLRYTFE